MIFPPRSGHNHNVFTVMDDIEINTTATPINLNLFSIFRRDDHMSAARDQKLLLSHKMIFKERLQKTEGGCNKEYRGLPVTSIAFILPLTFWVQFIVPEFWFLVLLHLVLGVVGFLFILDFKLRKPSLKMILMMIGVVSVTVGVIYAYTKFRLPHHEDESNHLFEEIIGDIYETATP